MIILESGKSVPNVAIKVDDGPLRAPRILSGRIKREASDEIEVMRALIRSRQRKSIKGSRNDLDES